MTKSKHAGSIETRRRARRTNSAINAAFLAVGLWLGLTAPQVSPVAPLPAAAAAAAATAAAATATGAAAIPAGARSYAVGPSMTRSVT